MEQEIALLIADLSGYTALTETHGALSAADLIEKYEAIVEDSLVGDSTLHQSVGDEVLIVSNTPDHLLSTAVMLIQNSSKHFNFLQIHGALHYGKILYTRNNYFGTTINLTSRMASKADAGTFVCSEDFLNVVSEKFMDKIKSKGKHRFKNVSEEKEIFEIIIDEPGRIYVDPVCRMVINKTSEFVSHPMEPNTFFCSQSCLEIYLRNNPAEMQ